MHRFMTLAQWEMLKAFIQRETGIIVPDQKRMFLEHECEQRAQLLGFETFSSYFESVQESPGREFQELVHLVAINETYFFREPLQFIALRDHLLPEVVRRNPNRPLRIWSAGTSTGEEAYSIAMIVQDVRQRQGEFEVEIIGTDIDQEALKHAKIARYGKNAFRSDAVLNANGLEWTPYFESDGDMFTLNPQIRDMVRFEYLNLTHDTYPNLDFSNFDFIFCRNVTLYFDRLTLKAVHQRFVASLKPEGYLFLASAETPHHNWGELRLKEVGSVFVYQKTETASIELPPSTPEPVPLLLDRYPAPLSLPEPTQPVMPLKTIKPPSLEAATIYFQKKEYARALHILDQTLTRYPDFSPAYILKANILINQEQFDEAEQVCRLLQGREAWNRNAYFLLGLLNFYRENFGLAKADLSKAIYLKPDFGLAHYYLGQVYERLAQPALAHREYRNALKNLEEGVLPGFSIESLRLICQKKISTIQT